VDLKRVKQFTVYFFILILLVNFLAAGCSNVEAREVVAKVNEEEIEKKDVERFLKVVYLFSGPQAEKTLVQEEQLAALEEEILRFLIENKVVQQEVKKLGLEVDLDKAKAVAEFEQTKKDLIKNIYGSEKDFNSRLKELKIDEKILKDFHEKAYYTELLFEHSTKDIGEKEARVFVAENPFLMKKPARIYAYHILLDNEEKAHEVRQLLEQGADFVETGKEHSLDSHVELGSIGAYDPYDPIFLEAAFKLNPGEISQPVETTFGFHLIKITEKEEEKELTFEEVKEDALEMKKREHFQKYFQNLIQEADVDTFNQKSTEDEMNKTPSPDK
jgi:foldase protein PrsA